MDQALQMIGMAKKAGKTAEGEYLCEDAVRREKSKLIIIATDISEKSRERIVNSCKFHKIDYIDYSDSENLGRITGNEKRVVVSINDEGFAKAIVDKISQ